MCATGLRTGELARAAGVNVQTLRYYERRGLLPPPARTPGGHRCYPPATVDRLRSIKAAQRLGFTLGEVADLLDQRVRGAGALRQRALDKLAELDRSVTDLRAVRDTLAEVVRGGCESLTDCTCPATVQRLLHRPAAPRLPGRRR